MKKIIIVLIVNFVCILSFSKNNIDFTYSNKNIGIAVVFPQDWELSTNFKNSNPIFKNFFREDKNENESPLFLGIKSNQQLFTRLLFEEYNADIDSYLELLNILFIQEDIEILSVKKYNDTLQIQYKTQKNNLSFIFNETIIKRKKYIIRLGFWTMDLLFKNNEKEINDIINNTYFLDEIKINNWIKDWDDLDIKLKNKDYDFIKVEKYNKKNIAEEKSTTGIFYEIKGINNSVYLMGSVHVGKPDFYPFRTEIEEIFKSTKNIVVELNINKNEVKEKSKALLQTAVFEDDKTIADVLSQDLYLNLKDKLSDFGLPIERFEKYQVWFLILILDSLQYVSAGYIDQYGVDKYFLDKSDDKNIIELETFDEQINLLRDVNYETYLAHTLFLFKAGQIYIDELINAWKIGDDKKLEELIFKRSNITSYDYKIIYEKLFYNRNIKFNNQIENFLNKKENYFVIVGSGHLIGDKGIIKLLENKGYQIKKY